MPTPPSSPPSPIPAWPCFLNGEFIDLLQARVSVLDRAFLFGDAIYDVVPVYNGKPFLFGAHMARMERGLAEMRIRNPLSRPEWRAIADNLVARHAAAEPRPPGEVRHQLVYFQVTRGVAMREHAMPANLQPTVFAMVNRMPVPSPQQRADGVVCISADDFRWRKAHLKSTSLLGAVFSKQLSVDAGVADTIMFRDGLLSEASASNVWIVQQGRVVGVPKGELVLEGVRYGLLETLCREEGIPFELREVTRAETLEAEEIILSSAVKELLPCVRLDGRDIGTGRPGTVFKRLYAAYQRAVAETSET